MTSCSSCGCDLTEEDAIEFHGKILCEDCYIEESNPPKPCDPLAVASAVTLRKQLGQTGEQGLSEQQKKIYHHIMREGKTTMAEIAAALGLMPDVLESEFTVLRHCELIRAHREENGKVYITLW
ncbi:MAG: hypothetical protein NWF00_04575 [Candidatus Bathyarchaeota archaeon]|nr:hypothetical protein [Candidatus Bathyarchaeota archaeon]